MRRSPRVERPSEIIVLCKYKPEKIDDTVPESTQPNSKGGTALSPESPSKNSVAGTV